MWEVLDMLRRAHRGEERRAIERTTGRSRKTVHRYLTTAAALGWQPGQREPDEGLAAQILARLRPGPRDRAPSDAEQRLLPHRETLRSCAVGDAPTSDHLHSVYSQLVECLNADRMFVGYDGED